MGRVVNHCISYDAKGSGFKSQLGQPLTAESVFWNLGRIEAVKGKTSATLIVLRYGGPPIPTVPMTIRPQEALKVRIQCS